MSAPIFLNKRTSNDLLWFADQVKYLEGVRVIYAEVWDVFDANLQIWGDASALGLAFWSPTHMVGYVADPILNTECNFNIFFNEAITILAALKWAAALTPIPK